LALTDLIDYGSAYNYALDQFLSSALPHLTLQVASGDSLNSTTVRETLVL